MRGLFWGVLAALVLHGGLAAALVSLDPRAWVFARPAAAVELDVVEPPPPEPLPPPPEPPPAPPRVVVRRIAKVALPAESPPPPNRETPPEPPPEPAPPVFGVTLDSVVTGDSAVAVPVGNTLMTPDRSPARAIAPLAPAPTGPPAFSPVPETYIADYPRVVHEVKPEYPSEARRLGVEGQVGLRVGIDRRGAVRSVRVVRQAGYGMDEAARQAMWRFRFTPARTKDGEAVDFLITYTHRFRADR